MHNSTNHPLRSGLHVKLVSLIFLSVLLSSCHSRNIKEEGADASPVNRMNVAMIPIPA